jgi:hypothetical protein
MGWRLPSSRRLPRWVRVAAVLWILTTGAVWNVVFDYQVDNAERWYVRAQKRYVRGERPPVAMTAVMDDAKLRGLRQATAWSGAMLLVGLAGLAGLDRRARGVKGREGGS